jgi:hypothetical protein
MPDKQVRLPVSFGGGEIAPSIYGRPDLKQQKTGQKSNNNYFVSLLGSVLNQPGTQYIDDTRDPTEKSRNIPFTFNREQSYELEFSDAGMRVIKDKALVLRDLVKSGVFKWTLSGSGTSEYYLELDAGGDPDLLETSYLLENSSKMTAGTVGSLSAGEWDYGDNDTLGYNTFYVRLTDSTDPDTKADGYVQTPFLLSVPYVLADIYDLDYTQSADTLYLTHSDYSPAKITRTADDAWTHTTFKYDYGLKGPYKARIEGDEDSTVDFTWVGTELRYDKTIGRWTVDASSGIFPTLSVDDPIKFGFEIPGLPDSLHWVRFFVFSQASSSQIVVYSFEAIPPYYQNVFNPTFSEGRTNWDDLSDGTIANTEVRYDISTGRIVLWDNNAGVQALIEQPVAVLANRVYTVELITGTIGGAPQGRFRLGVGKSSKGTFYVNQPDLITSDTTYTYDFRTEGELIYVWVDTFNAASGATQEIVSIKIYLNDDNRETNEWRLPMWNATDGYPSKCLLHNNRLWFFNSPNYPDTWWASKLGDYEIFDFSTPPAATDGFSFALNSTEINEIRWAASHGDKGVLIGTTGGEYIITGSDGVSTPDALSIKVTQLSKYGSIDLKPLTIGNSVLFSPKERAGIIELTFSLESGGYVSKDLSYFASHLFKGRRIVSWAYQRNPNSLILIVLDNGDMLTLSYLKEVDIKAFSKRICPLGAGYAHVSSIPDSDDDKIDDVYIIVNRAEVGETENYFLEVIEPEIVSQTSSYGKSAAGSPYDYRYIESAVRLDNPKTITNISVGSTTTITSVAHGFSNGNFVRLQNIIGTVKDILNNNVYKVASVAADTFVLNDASDNDIDTTGKTYLTGGEARKMVTSMSGLDHLEGKTNIVALADGEVYENLTVSSGSVTFTGGATASFATAGIPITPELTTASLDISLNSLGSVKGVSRIFLYFIESLYCEVRINEGEWKVFELTPAGATETLVPFTGVKEINLDTPIDYDITISVRNPKPLPLHISSIFVDIEVNG